MKLWKPVLAVVCASFSSVGLAQTSFGAKRIPAKFRIGAATVFPKVLVRHYHALETKLSNRPLPARIAVADH